MKLSAIQKAQRDLVVRALGALMVRLDEPLPKRVLLRMLRRSQLRKWQRWMNAPVDALVQLQDRRFLALVK